MATIPSVQLFRNSNIISGRSAAINTLERQKEYVPDGGLILATYSSDNGVKTLLGIVRNSGSENAQITIMDVEGAAENVQDAIDALSADTNTKLTEEKNAREAADTTLQGNIDTLSSDTNTKLDAEKNARESADNTLQTNIDNLSSSTDTKINAEVTRATEKEAELSSTITSNYTTLSTAIDDEKKRAEAKESDLNAKIQALDGSLGDTVSTTVASGEYSSTDKAIYLKNASGETLSTINATDFIKDGMVTSVSVVGENLVITFNTDAGHEDINIPISAIFNANNYYTKTEIDTKVDDINSQLSEYGQTTSQALNDLATRLDDYGKVTSQSLNDLSTKFGDYYTKIEVDEAIANVDVTSQLQNYYTKTEVDTKDATINATIEALSSDTKNKIDAEASARQEADNTLQGNINNVNSGLTAHTANTTVHVTQADKDKWNTPTDLSNYYTKAEVDGKDATLQTALDALDAHVSENEDIVSQSLNDLNNRIGNTYVKSYIDALEARIAELETKFLNMENNGLQAGEY